MILRRSCIRRSSSAAQKAGYVLMVLFLSGQQFVLEPRALAAAAAGAPVMTPAPAQPTSVQPTSVQPTPVQPTSVQPTPVQPTPVQPTPVQQNPAQSAPAVSESTSDSSLTIGPGVPVTGSVEYDEGVPDYSSAPQLAPVDALNEVLVNGPRSAAIRAQFGIAQAGFATATQVPNPIFFFDRGLVAEQENRIGPLFTAEPPWKLMFRMIAQKRLVDQTRFDLMSQLWQLRSDARRAYTEVVVAQESYKTLNDLYALALRLERVCRKRFMAGDVPGLDVLKARLATSQADVDRVVGAQRVIRARQQLNVIMGRDVDSPVNVPPLPDYAGGTAVNPFEGNSMLPDFSKDIEPISTYLQLANSTRLELKSLIQQQRVNDVNLKLAYANMLPNPTLALGKSTGGNVPTGPKLTAVFFTVNMGMPMTDFNQDDIIRYTATRKLLRYQIEARKNEISSGVAGAYQNLISARDKLRTYQDSILSESAKVARLARRSYEVGQSDITSTLSAQQANVQTRISYLDAVSAYQAAFTDLEQACGMPLD